MEFSLRETEPRDLLRLEELEKVLFPGESPWTRAMFEYELGLEHTWYVCGVEKHTGEVIGYAGLARMGPEWEPEFEVHTIGVDPRWQGRGVGRALLEALLARACGPVYLEVRTDNAPAIALYERYGFVKIGIRKRYYQPSGADAFTMRREAQVPPVAPAR